MTMKNYSDNDFRLAFQQGFKFDIWQDWLANLFGASLIHQKPVPVKLPPSEKDEGIQGFLLGELTTSDGVRMGLFRYTVPAVQIERRRVGLNRLVEPWVRYDFDAALVVFDAKDTKKWRFSLVADMRGDKTSPKRYTYVFGDSTSQYRTAVGRFMKVRDSRAQSDDKPVSFAVLKEAFAVESLTKEFYGELFNWYLWALSPEAAVTFPNDISTDSDDRIGLEERLIRLITRLMFVWFILQKKLVPDALFNENSLTAWLKDFDPHSMTSGNYYNAILQNLFFATLNNEIANRAFATDARGFRGRAEDYGIKTLFRNPKGDTWFKRPDEEVLDLFKEVPFLNGGLFECLDKAAADDSKGRVIYNDGFSREKGRQRRAFIPNELFFGDESPRTFTVSGAQTTRTVSGLLKVLGRYNFTIEENTPDDMDVALDPELLGKVFENLLGSFNPETRETARKASGSFYTPREIVGYMVESALDAYMKPVADKPEQEQLVHLMKIRVLDPACGSGAFPMGMLNAIVARAQKLGATDDLHALKLHVIENCIFGVDIQTIAVQIAKLRFFISLVCEEQPNLTDAENNYGISPLPNLETKFVAANALIALKKPEVQVGQMALEDLQIAPLKQELDSIRHRHFNAKTRKDKLALRKEDEKTRLELAALLAGDNIFAAADARQLVEWNPYEQNESAGFFDPEWMFGVEGGFDVVIGNPPYISAPDQLKSAALKNQRETLAKDSRFTCLVQKWDLYIAFVEISLRLFLRNGGVFAMIVPYPLTNQTYGAKLRKTIVREFALRQLVDLQGVKVFENATVTNCIPFVEKATPLPEVPIVRVDDSGRFHITETLALADFMPDEKTCVWKTTKEENFLARFKDMHTLGDYCYISVGMVLHANEKTNKGEFTKDDLVSNNQDTLHCREYIEAKDIARYEIGRIRYLEYGSARCPSLIRRPTFPELYRGCRILVNCLGTIQAALDDGMGLLHNHSLYAIVPWRGLCGVANKSISASVKRYCSMTRDTMEQLSQNASERYLLAILNSRLGLALLNAVRGGDYHILPEHLRAIPIPSATPAQQTEIAELVDRVIAAKKANPAADTSAIEREIDELVFDLYGLTPQERETVQGDEQ